MSKLAKALPFLVVTIAVTACSSLLPLSSNRLPEAVETQIRKRWQEQAIFRRPDVGLDLQVVGRGATGLKGVTGKDLTDVYCVHLRIDDQGNQVHESIVVYAIGNEWYGSMMLYKNEWLIYGCSLSTYVNKSP
jgi:hypothetical protein